MLHSKVKTSSLLIFVRRKEGNKETKKVRKKEGMKERRERDTII
jgi:hypothetical protein